MVNVFLVRPTGNFPGQTEILKRQSRFPDWEVPNGNSFTIYKFLEFVLVSCCNWNQEPIQSIAAQQSGNFRQMVNDTYRSYRTKIPNQNLRNFF